MTYCVAARRKNSVFIPLKGIEIKQSNKSADDLADGGALASQKVLDTIVLALGLLLSLLMIASFTQAILGGNILQTFAHTTSQIISSVFALTIVLIIVVLVLENSSPVYTLAWIMVLIFLPVIGFFLYLFFGRNWRKMKLFGRKGLVDKEVLKTLQDSLPVTQPGVIAESLPHKLFSLLKYNSKALLTYGNSIELYDDTREAFAAILAAIDDARHHVHLEYFFVADDETGRTLKNLLIRKAKMGVEIRFIYDDVACWRLSNKFKNSMKEAGIQFVPFMPVLIPLINSRMNYRNHRKLVIVDGQIAFLGGLNIGDQYLGKSKRYSYWRDSVAAFRGESIISLQAVFMADWLFVKKENLFAPERFTQYMAGYNAADPGHHCPVQVLASGPDSEHASALQLYFLAIANAQKSIRINTPYLILNDSLLMALKTAALSGVKIQLILPSTPDHYIVYWGSRSYFEELLEVGVEIFEYVRGFMHAKILIVDDEILGLGTANMDMRSFNHNFELTALVYDPKIVSMATEVFFEDLNSCRQILLSEFQKRSIKRRSLESLCRLFSPLL